MTARRWVFETLPDGGHQFVSLKRSRSHHHDRHHHHRHEQRCCRDDCCHKTRDEWNDLVERNRKLHEANDGLNRENYALKCNLQAADGEARRLGGLVAALQAENQLLREENASLRCTIENSGDSAAKYLREVERLKNKLHKVEKDRDGLVARIRELTRHAHHGASDRVDDLKRAIAAWERKFDVVDDHNKRLRRDIEDQRCVITEQDERIRVYVRILRRHGFIRCD